MMNSTRHTSVTFVGANGGVMVQWATANQCAGADCFNHLDNLVLPGAVKALRGWFSVAPWAGGGSGRQPTCPS
jgi:hypothetical protein